MPVKLHIENFQSLENAQLVIDGLTVVTGQNNSGKSSAHRAVLGLFTNAPSTAFLRHGTDKLSVSMEFSGTEAYQADTVVWEKGTKFKPTYTVNGKMINPGRELPKEVLALGIQPVSAGSVTLWPQIAPQFSGTVFLLDLSGSAIAEAVADVDRVGKLTGALKFAETDKRSATSELKVRRKDVALAQETVNQYTGLDDVVSLQTGLQALYTACANVQAQQRWVTDWCQRAKTIVAQIAWLTSMRVAVQVPDSQPATEAVSQVQAARGMQAKLFVLRTRVTGLSGVSDVALPSVPDKVGALIQMLDTIRGLKTRYNTAQQQITSATKILSSAKLPDALSITLFSESAELRTLSAKYKQAQLEYNTLSKFVTDTEAAHKAAVAEVQALLGENGECPVCGTVSSSTKHEH